MAKKKKGARDYVSLECTECGSRNYRTSKQLLVSVNIGYNENTLFPDVLDKRHSRSIRRQDRTGD